MRSHIEKEMPRGDKCVERIAAYIHDPAIGLLHGFWQGPEWNMSSENSWARKAREVWLLVVCIKLVFKKRYKVMRIRSKQGVFFWQSETLTVHDGEC